MKKNLLCPCGNNISFDFDEEIDLDAKPEILDHILKGTFMSYNCSSCFKLHKPEYKVTFYWKSKKYSLTVLPELDRGDFYLKKKETYAHEIVIGFPEMADRITVIKDGLEPAVIETLKAYILAKAEEKYPENDIDVWYYCTVPSSLEFHLDGIRRGEVAVMRIPQDMYDKTLLDYQKHPKSSNFTSLRVRSYLSVQNLLRPDALK
ncbi:MAG: CpXC domain-containing protein [Treponema sp.]|nr:CpXC domain-containing protein [Treponema sp.]